MKGLMGWMSMSPTIFNVLMRQVVDIYFDIYMKKETWRQNYHTPFFGSRKLALHLFDPASNFEFSFDFLILIYTDRKFSYAIDSVYQVNITYTT